MGIRKLVAGGLAAALMTAVTPTLLAGAGQATAAPSFQTPTATTASLVDASIRRSQRAVVKVTVTPGHAVSDGYVNVRRGDETLVMAAPLDGNGQATIRLPKLGAGKHRLYAAFTGTGTAAGSPSNVVTLRVKR